MESQELKFSNLEDILRQCGEEIVAIYRQLLQQTGTDATGNLGNTLNYILETDGSAYIISLQLQDYWKYVEDGRSAGKYPPLSDIRSWIRTKRILPRAYNGKLPTENQLAYLIARKIHLQGTEGKHILSNTLDIFENNYMQLIEDAITKDLENQLDNFILKRI